MKPYTRTVKVVGAILKLRRNKRWVQKVGASFIFTEVQENKNFNVNIFPYQGATQQVEVYKIIYYKLMIQ